MRRPARRPKGLPVGSIATGMIVGQAKRGVLVEVGPVELLLPRSRYGAAAARIEEAGYGDALTVEVAAVPEGPGGDALTRVGIERSIRQPRSITGSLQRKGSGLELRPDDGSPAFAVVVLDHLAPDDLIGHPRPWLVGGPHRGVRFVEPA